jgi:hypothetical protein
MAETKREKAERYLREGRVKPGPHCYYVAGDTGTWQVTRRSDKALRCSCPAPAKTVCSHRLAVKILRDTKEAEKQMADTNGGTKMVAAAQQTALAPQLARPEPVGEELDALWTIAEKLAQSSMFGRKRKQWNRETKQEEWVSEAGDPADVFSVILAGRDFNLSAAASARHLKMIKGALSISAEIMRAMLHQFGYEYEVKINRDDKGLLASATMWLWRVRDNETRWETTYTMRDAQQAGLIKEDGGWTRNPEDMLVARVTTRGVRRYAPEVLNKTYLPEELGYYEEDDGQGGTRLVSMEVDGAPQDVTETAPTAAEAPSGPTPPKAAPKARRKPPVQPASPPEPEPEPEDDGIVEGEYEVEGDPGSVQRFDLDDGEEDEEIDVATAPEPAPEPPPAEKPKAARKKAEPPPADEPAPAAPASVEEIAADQLAYLPDGTPANEATRLWEAANAAPDEPAAEEPAEEPVAPIVAAEESRYYANAGALRAFLASKGIKFHDKFKTDVGYGEVSWPGLDEDARLVIYLAARDGME